MDFKLYRAKSNQAFPVNQLLVKFHDRRIVKPPFVGNRRYMECMKENKGQNHRTNKVPRIKKPQYFKSGLLVYEDLSHPLTRDGNYYRCALNCHGECDTHAKLIPTETLEKAFARKIKTFAIKPAVADFLLKKSFKKISPAYF